MIALLVSSFLLAHAEVKTCVVKGMVCQNCVEMVTKNVCTDAYSTCRVRLKDKKNRVGEVVLGTKDPAAKIDFGRVGEELTKLTYSLGACVNGDSSAPR